MIMAAKKDSENVRDREEELYDPQEVVMEE